MRQSGLSAARVISVGYNGILFVPFKIGVFPYYGRFPVRDFSSDENRWANRSRMCPSFIRQELERIIRPTSFSTASGGQVRRRSGMCF